MAYSAFVEEVVRLLVDEPEAVVIEEELDGNTRTFFVRVAAEDVGKVIGKSGRVVSALRAVVSAIASKEREKAYVKVVTDS
ncbi:MAG: KH domain-containing protein [Methanoregulaceae archaeon]|jgi:predicted RNA-binding protein YlqC (UPF0109 family)|nr:KH domain-containing protein [Methanoregulaceae archaeon]